VPTYQYACTDCDHRFEAVQAFSDASLTVCPECGGKLRKVFSSVGIVFKGSGFYRTDSRASAGSTVAKSESSSDSSSSNSESTSTSTEKKSESTSESKSGSKAESKSGSKSESKSSKSTPAAAAS
jgi:putative FmdB family regulatory protein